MLIYSVHAVMELENKSDQTYSTFHIQKETQREKKKERKKKSKENYYVHFLACVSRLLPTRRM